MYYDVFKMLCEANNKKPTPVVIELGLSSGCIARWQKGVMPDGNTLNKVADYFGVSTDLLLERKSFEKIAGENSNMQELTPEEAELLRLYRKADVNGQFKIIAAAMNATGKKEKPHLVPGTAIAAYGGGVISDPPVEDDIIT